MNKVIENNVSFRKSRDFDGVTPSSARKRQFITTPLVLGVIVFSANIDAQDYFDKSALEVTNDSAKVNIESFSNSGKQLPGRYRVDVYVNDNYTETESIDFVDADSGLIATLTPDMLNKFGVNLNSSLKLSKSEKEVKITSLDEFIPNAFSKFDFPRLRLDLSIPDVAMQKNARGQIDKKEWDQGIPALLLDYNASGSNNKSKTAKASSNSQYVNLRTGVNLGAWRMRNYSTYSKNNRNSKWESVSNYLERDIQALNAQMVAGDSSTPSELFDSVQFRGIQLVSDDNMYPDSLRGFAPIVRGIANSNAKVTIRQNGYVIYQTYVAPGAFEITDLYPTASSGDLDVTVTEADGTERKSIQTFSAVPIMLREGRSKFAVGVGRYRTLNIGARKPIFGYGTYTYGLPYNTTIYSGLQLSENYSSVMAGLGHGFGEIGSLSFDVTQANTKLMDNSRNQGQSYRIQYAKDIKSTNTTVTLAGYRYSTAGFYDFKESNELGSVGANGRLYDFNKRSRAQININQSLGDYGNFYLSGYQQDYWGEDGYTRSLSAGYNVTHNQITYGLNINSNQYPNYNRNDKAIAFNVQIPLSKWLPNAWASYGVSRDNTGRTNNQVGINGTALDDNTLSYSAQQSYQNKESTNSGSLTASYKSQYGEVSSGYNYSNDSSQWNYGARGGLVAHPYGVTLSQQLGDTIALVKAPGVKNAKISSNPGVRTDWRGYAIVPYLSTYRRNNIALDTETFEPNADVANSSVKVVPTKGALVLADFKTRIGRRKLIKITYNGNPIPFGSTVTLVQENDMSPLVAIADQQGEVYLSGVPDNASVAVTMGGGKKCLAKIIEDKTVNDIDFASAKCI